MENYIVRVLRRIPGKEKHQARLDGVVEVVENGKRCAFHNADELWSILGEEIASLDEQIATLELSDDESDHYGD